MVTCSAIGAQLEQVWCFAVSSDPDRERGAAMVVDAVDSRRVSR